MQSAIRIRSIRLLIIMSLLASQSIVYASDKTRTVRATGSAVGEGAAAKAGAILDAQRKAVIEAAGVFIDAQSLVNNYELIDETILSHARGYVTDTKIINNWNENGLTYCEIRAVVGVGNLERDWKAALPQLIHRQSAPRCVVIFSEDADTTDSIPAKPGGSCAHRIENLLQKSGLRLIDKHTIDQVLFKDTEAAFLRGDAEQIAAKAQQFDAELLIFGQAQAEPLGPQSIGGRTLYRWEMVLDARIIRADTAEVIVTDSYPLKTPHMAVNTRCGSKGFRKLADKVGPKLLRDLTDHWQKRFQHRIFEVQFHGCSANNLRQQIVPALSRMPGVRAYRGVDVKRTAMEESSTEIYWAGNLSSLANAINQIKIDNVEFEEESSSGGRIRFEVIGLD